MANSLSLRECLDPVRMVRNICRNAFVLSQLTRREIESRYRASVAGLLWALISPMVMLGIYVLVFGVALRLRWPGEAESGLGGYAVTVFAGMVIFNLFSDSLGRAPTLITANPNYVKKMIFPLEILPLAVLGAGLFHALVGVLIAGMAQWIWGGGLHWTLFWLPLVFIPLAALTAGVSWFLAGLGVFFRDAQQLVGLAITALLFLTPVFYCLESLPPRLAQLLQLNPLAYYIGAFRAILVWGQAPDWRWGLANALAAVAVMILGYAFFMRTKDAFADVL